ncbi:type IV conjugative transfer system protein TraE [Aliivibrio fischeri]|uniref:Type IV conjugative transfer system protein TraE n=1 Tax=Aliivibrio fischeri TaxID=668 RepID=A0A844P7J8_ALIFS|nr:type IV conjugative transfer system protein TraE [Aliivibrio fischeri]
MNQHEVFLKTSNRDDALNRVRFFNKILIGFSSLVTVFALGFGASTVYLATHQERTLLPPNMESAITVSSYAVSDTYLSEMAEYFLALKLNVTPENVVRNYGQLLNYVASEHYASVQPLLAEEATQIKQQKISSVFFISSVNVSNEHFAVRITGTLQKYVGSRALAPEPMTYFVYMSYPSGTLALNRIAKQTKEPTS